MFAHVISDVRACFLHSSLDLIVSRSWHLQQHAGLLGGSVLGNVSGAGVSAVPQCCCKHHRGEVLHLLQHVEMAFAYSSENASAAPQPAQQGMQALIGPSNLDTFREMKLVTAFQTYLLHTFFLTVNYSI